jgi:hypothetical protein
LHITKTPYILTLLYTVLRRNLMKKQVLALALLIAVFAVCFPARAQDNGGCDLDLAAVMDLLTSAQESAAAGDMNAALDAVSKARAALQLAEAKCESWAPETAGDSRTNPAPYRQRQYIAGGDASIEIVGVNLTADAIVMDANQFNDEPTDEIGYILIDFIYYCELPPAESCEYSAWDFKVVGDIGRVYDGVASGFENDVEVFGGGRASVQRALLVAREDAGLQLFYDERKLPRVFFLLTE